MTAARPLLQIVRGGDDDNITSLLKHLRRSEGKTGQGGSGGRLRGPEQIVVSDGELDVRDDLANKC